MCCTLDSAIGGSVMRKIVSGAAIAALVSTSLSAQSEMAASTPTQIATSEPAGLVEIPAPSVLAGPAMLSLNGGTPITLAMAEEVNSSTHREGDTFRLMVLDDVTVGNT